MENEIFVKSVEMPLWLKNAEDTNLDKVMHSDEEKMHFVIGLAIENVKNKTGGPFAAAIFDIPSNRLVAVGANCVVPANQSWAHAEMIAFARAQNKLNTFNLQNCMLVTSCEPCAMCFGATPWSGIKELIYGAEGDAARSINFDEGDKVKDWQDSLKRRGIAVRGPILQDEAFEPFKLYQEQGNIIY